MQVVHWWVGVTPWEKKRAVRFLNREVASLGAVSFPVIAAWARYRERLRHGLPSPTVRSQLAREDKTLSVQRHRLTTVNHWLRSGIFPADVRRCKHEPCSHFFLVPADGRAKGKLYHDPKCRRNFHCSKFMNRKIRANRARKLARVRRAMKVLRKMPDWKQRVARSAGVTKNFITYATRRGEI